MSAGAVTGDPALGGLDEELARARARCTDESLPLYQRREAAMYASGLRRGLFVLTGRDRPGCDTAAGDVLGGGG